MKDETRLWLDYAKENFESAKVLLKSDLYNSCLQNTQQSIEKALKAIRFMVDWKIGVVINISLSFVLCVTSIEGKTRKMGDYKARTIVPFKWPR